jgi:hypothetical protein
MSEMFFRRCCRAACVHFVLIGMGPYVSGGGDRIGPSVGPPGRSGYPKADSRVVRLPFVDAVVTR